MIYFICMMLIFAAELFFCRNPDMRDSLPITVAVLEDQSRNLSFTDIRNDTGGLIFTPQPDSSLMFGTSRSTWWGRINADALDKPSKHLYFTVYNITAQSVSLFIPVYDGGGIRYVEMHSGWGFDGNVQDEGFLYPVFQLPEEYAPQSDIYLRLYTPFIQNYTLQIIDQIQFERTICWTMLFVGAFLGVLLAMAIYNLSVFIGMRDKAYLFYVIYIVSVVLYQMSVLGIYRLLLDRPAEILISHAPTFGTVMLIFALLFIYVSFDIKNNFPKLRMMFIAVLLLCSAATVLILFGYHYIVNLFSSFTILIISTLLIALYVLAIKKRLSHAFLFMIAESIMCTGVFILFLRCHGYLSNNLFSISILLVSSAAESVIMSTGLVRRAKHLTSEKERTMNLYKDAQAAAKLNELAYLQAQIKPHFLYNAINVIAALCQLNPEKARELLLDLSSYLHHAFDYRNPAERISIEKELEFVQAYVRIQEARFKDRFRVIYEFGIIRNLYIPPLILQPLVENAIQHGLLPGGGGGCVIVRIACGQDFTFIQVEDNGVGMTESELASIFNRDQKNKEGIGIINIKRRLEMSYGISPVIQSSPGKGTVVTITVPSERNSEYESNIG